MPVLRDSGPVSGSHGPGATARGMATVRTGREGEEKNSVSHAEGARLAVAKSGEDPLAGLHPGGPPGALGLLSLGIPKEEEPSEYRRKDFGT